MPREKSTPQDVAGLLDSLNGVKDTLRKSKLASGTIPAERKIKLDQKKARVDLVAAKYTVAMAGTLAMISEQIGLQSCALDTPALRGALLQVLDKAKDPQEVVKFRERDEQFQLTRRRAVTGIKTFVAVANPSAALIAKAKELKLKRDELAGGFKGHASLDALVEVGRNFNCTVRVLLEGKQVELVTDGNVDTAIEAAFATNAKGEAADETSVEAATMEKDKDDGLGDADQSAEAPPEASRSSAAPAASASGVNSRSTFSSKAPPSDYASGHERG